MNKENNLLSAKILSGMDVVNPTHEALGEIEDIMIDPATGNIVYAVLTFGGFMGFGEKYFAIPWEAFYLDTKNEDVVILNIPREKLENAPGFDKNDWPDNGQWEFVDKIYRHFGYRAYTNNIPLGKKREIPTEVVLKGNSGLGNSGKLSSFKDGKIVSSRIKQSGIS